LQIITFGSMYERHHYGKKKPTDSKSLSVRLHNDENEGTSAIRVNDSPR